MPKRKTPKGWYSDDVPWYIPNRKKPIAYSTTCARDIINSVPNDGDTIQKIYDKITYDVEAKMVLKAYIDKGYGDWVWRSDKIFMKE